jgi:DNA-binding response OmpR family regulator
VDLTADGQEGLAYDTVNDYDVIILDLMLPRMDGLTVLRSLRRQGRNTHVLILSAKDQVVDPTAAAASRIRSIAFRQGPRWAAPQGSLVRS